MRRRCDACAADSVGKIVDNYDKPEHERRYRFFCSRHVLQVGGDRSHCKTRRQLVEQDGDAAEEYL